MMMSGMLVKNLARRKAYPVMSSLAATTSLQTLKPRPRTDSKASKVLLLSRVTRTSVGLRKIFRKGVTIAIMVISKVRPRILCENLESLPETTWRI